MTERNETASAFGTTGQIDETIDSIARIHDEHARRIGPIQNLANRTTGLLGRPAAVVGIVALMLLWVSGNLLLTRLGNRAIDRFPFPTLEFIATVCAFTVTLLILTTQRHEQEEDRKRDQLTLHMAVLTEKKIAKVIALLEEQRRDNPLLATRHDAEAETMAQPADPRTSIDHIEGSSLGEPR